MILQFGCFAALALGYKVILHDSYWHISQAVGVLLGLWAIFSIKLKHLSIFPEPKDGSLLVTHGPYKWLRHPMYTAVLLFFGPVAVYANSLVAYLIVILLLLTLLVKLHYEERRLNSMFADYRQYQKRSKKLIPFVY